MLRAGLIAENRRSSLDYEAFVMHHEAEELEFHWATDIVPNTCPPSRVYVDALLDLRIRKYSIRERITIK